MFYSHEILTSREHGVATVWLVATLGSRPACKKISRKAILDVNVPKACETILTPEVPMALRLQSSLLFGVSRIYSQQCGYVLADAQNAQSTMRALLKVVKPMHLDPNAGRVRADQLVLEDDPAFLPDLFLPRLDMNLPALDVSTEDSSQQTSLLSMRSKQSSESSVREGDESKLGLIIPTSDSDHMGGLSGFPLSEDERAFVPQGVLPIRRPRGEESGRETFFADDDFNIDNEGNIVDAEGNMIGIQTRTPVQQGPDDKAQSRFYSDSAASSQVRRDYEEGLRAGQVNLEEPANLNLDLQTLGDRSDYALPAAEPFQLGTVAETVEKDLTRASSTVPQQEQSSASAGALVQHKRRAPKVLPMDARQGMRNVELAQWNNDYVENMAELIRAKVRTKLSSQGKKNARWWIFGSGIGGVGAGLGTSKFESPLHMFSGESLMQALNGLPQVSTGQKRSHSEEELTSSKEERRVRSRDGGPDVGRGDALALDEGGQLALEDDIELGRDAAVPLEEYSAQMPWNLSASVRGSRQGSAVQVRGLASSVGGFPTSAGGLSSIPQRASSTTGHFDRRASRVTSASPLTGRGLQRLGDLDIPTGEDGEQSFGEPLISDDFSPRQFELYDPLAGVSTQAAAQSQLIKSTLDLESTNFLEFVKQKTATRSQPAEDAQGEQSTDNTSKAFVTFEELLPPERETKIVAAQGFLHVLALTTKNLITVQQKESYGPLHVSIVTEL